MVRRVQPRDADDWRDEIRRLARMTRAFELEERKSEVWKGHVRSYAAALTTLIDPAMDTEARALLRATRVAEHCKLWSPPKLVRPRDPILDVLGVADLPMESFDEG